MDTLSIITGKTISTKNIKLLMRRLNGGETMDLSFVWDNPIRVEDPKQGREWLLNLWKTPNGKERKNNPFGYREEDVLEKFEYFEFAGTYNTGNRNIDYNVPVYNVIGKDGSFQYYMNGGKIHIIG